MNNSQKKRTLFGSKFGIIAAAAGSAVGLGNIWKFPYVVGQNGGGAFLLVYIACVIFLGLPVMLSEFIIGRRSQRDVFGAFTTLSGKKGWGIIGIIGVLTAFLILSFYYVVSGWGLEYVYQAATNVFSQESPMDFKTVFEHFSMQTWRPVLWQIVFIGLTGGIIAAGVEKGIERSSKIMMPMLLVIMILLSIKAVTLPNSAAGLEFYLKPDFSKITPKVILNALGLAFFSLSLGMGCMITYGSYMGKKNKLMNIAFNTTLIDTLVAILAGLIIFPAVFSLGIRPDQGAELIFITLPGVFAQMGGGYFFSVLFFLLLTLAALTSTISLMEVIIAYMVEELHINRKRSVLIVSVILVMTSTLVSTSLRSDFNLELFGKNFFDLFDIATSKVLMPLGGFLITLFLGWFYNKKAVYEELSNGGKIGLMDKIYMFLLRYFLPIAILLVFANELGLMNWLY